VASQVSTFEPFCLLWSKTGTNTIDTLAFVPLTFWPPIKPVPFVSLLPLCPIPLNPFEGEDQGSNPINCKFCEFILGFPIADFSIGPYPMKLTIQTGGVAMSWGDKAKLAFGTNAAVSGNNEASSPKIWDGFRSFELGQVPDINFWTAFKFNIVPLPTFTFYETRCAVGATKGQKVANLILPTKSLFLELDFEMYIGFDKTTFSENGGGNATETGAALAANIGTTPDDRKLLQKHKEGQQLWRDLQETSEDPCVIIAMTAARIKAGIIGTLILGNGIGGFCNFSPEESGVRCNPSGFFFNLEQKFTLEGGLGGPLASMLAETADAPTTQASGNSIGIFQHPNGENEAVVFRVEFPVMSIFGVTFPGIGRPIVHFQFIKGSEVERRRQTILRRRASTGSPWIYNCKM
jgi:hypothetical protein